MKTGQLLIVDTLESLIQKLWLILSWIAVIVGLLGMLVFRYNPNLKTVYICVSISLATWGLTVVYSIVRNYIICRTICSTGQTFKATVLKLIYENDGDKKTKCILVRTPSSEEIKLRIPRSLLDRPLFTVGSTYKFIVYGNNYCKLLGTTECPETI